MVEVEEILLPNGIRFVHKQVSHIKIAHVGAMLDIGSRDEERNEMGLAHFWEHMAFKGTKKRKAYHILNRLESLGGELNAYTTKEKICFYASILQNHLDKAIELLADITFNSTFPEKQIERERTVILEEMAMYRDAPEDALLDDFDELIFKDHALGTNILGVESTVNGFHQSHFLNFIQRNLNTSKIVISSVGNYPMKKIEKLVHKYFQGVPYKNHTQLRDAFETYEPNEQTRERPISQVHWAYGAPAYSLGDPKRIPFFMLTNILGGPAMNSRLNLALREKHGLVYGVDANYTPYTDTGLFVISFATDKKQLKKAQSLVYKEIRQLQQKPMGELQLHKAKQQLKGQLAMSEENNNAMMLMMAKSLLDQNTIPDLDKIFEMVDGVGKLDLMEMANEILDPERMSSLSYLPTT
jgi:predicted Zn-dependent peptidase